MKTPRTTHSTDRFAIFAQILQELEDAEAEAHWARQEGKANHAVFNKMTLPEKVELVAAARDVFAAAHDVCIYRHVAEHKDMQSLLTALLRLRTALEPASDVIT